MSDNRPIGVLDSGLGGLTVVKELYRLMPMEKVVYFGDTARFPYGRRSADMILSSGLQGALFLAKKDIKMLVVACNTISSVALEQIQKRITGIPVIGVIKSSCRAAVMRTAEMKIGIIGTVATIKTDIYTKEIANIKPSIRVYNKECPLFVPLIEEGIFAIDIAHMISQHYLYELVDIGIDCLILACAHYPALMEVIQSTVSSRIELIDCAMWTAKEAQNILLALKANSEEQINGLEQSHFYLTDFYPNFEKIAARLLGSELKKVELVHLAEAPRLTA